MKLRFHTLDVFTDRRFAGNPLAVVLAADALDGATMQKIAREFNLSETVFVLEPLDPVNTARLRIFTPSAELPFAGHPTIGAAALIASRRAPDMLARNGLVVALEEEIGVLRCDVSAGAEGRVFARFAAPRLPWGGGEPPQTAALAAALGLESADIGFRRHAPSRFSAGVEFLFVPVNSRAALDRAQPDLSAFGAVLGASRGAYLYTTETMAQDSAVLARSFPHGVGVAEDPATGSAAAAFAAVAHAFEAPEDGEHEFVIEQGYRVGRPSRIIVGSRIECGQLAAVSVAGASIGVLSGELEL
ncbi:MULTISPECIES: PhzF family phenazine biosynthesis protein [Methylosinus]|uniref:PhzF family phenazine biosynthesis protein n=1 Tax=Methylosinus trichosporium (strain ATCC 35070 / NCIMB 11131 / UNIQEM 75 / OB3b) TaxID=595536 RepID=A0A2D2CY10_METT3|nr:MULTISPECIES: PhzF family phenazine biosynthesis protein [Methylosinus]ATQ67627.1 PhzF family phenazine biosynthesis protein [Methylosinus trichosporium OB3b]OBS52166.1 phenazine biosynthesis protein PhzF [Methylosinus sp. 3S-1]